MNSSACVCQYCNKPFTSTDETIWVNSTQFHKNCVAIYPKMDGKISMLLVHVLREFTDHEARLLAHEIEKRCGRYSDI